MTEIVRFAGEEEWIEGVTGAIATRLRTAIQQRGQASLLLAGGGTPAPVYRALARREDVDWSKVHFFWGDERHVPPEHEESNFRMAYETLLRPLGIERDDPRVHRVPTQGSPRQDASLYEQNLRVFFKLEPGALPRFDVALLGMGGDGHTASLFPGTEALAERERLMVANPVPALDTIRLTVTFPVLNAARTVIVLARGADKAERLREVLEGAPGRYPVQQVRPEEGDLLWMLDAAAASQLPGG